MGLYLFNKERVLKMAKIGDIIVCYEQDYINIYCYRSNTGRLKNLYNVTENYFLSVPGDYFKGKKIKIFPKEMLEFLLKNQREEFVKLQHPDGKDFPELNVCPICGKDIVVYTIWKLNPPYVNEMHYDISCCWCGLKLDKGLMVSPKELSQIWNGYSKKRWKDEI